MWTAIIVEDEIPALELLGILIKEHTDLQVAGMFTLPHEALKAVASLAPDVAFLDIEMPGMGGLELASRLLQRFPNLEIIFVTAYREYALEAFNVSALDYLLKPVSAAEITRCWERIRRRLPDKEVGSAASTTARLTCFGGFELFGPNQTDAVRFSTSKVEELLAFLVVQRGTGVSKWEICEQLWPEAEPERAEQSLYTAVYRLKKSFVEHGIDFQLDSKRGSYRLIGEGYCDLVEFERTMEEPSGMGKKSLKETEDVFAMYKGPLFAGKDYSWSQPIQERLKRKYAVLGKRLAFALLENGSGKRATETLLQLLEHDPFDEEAYELLLESYAHLKERTSFLQLYDKFQDMLSGELGLKVSSRMSQLRQAVLES